MPDRVVPFAPGLSTADIDAEPAPPWPVLCVEPKPSLAPLLANLTLEHNSLTLTTCDTLDAACRFLTEGPEFAVILLDPGFHEAGPPLAVIARIVTALGDRATRLILVPAESLPANTGLDDDDIQDIRLQSELTPALLRRVMIAAIRSFVGLRRQSVHQAMAAQQAAILALGALAEFKDNPGTGHLFRIQRLTSAIARELLLAGHWPDQVNSDLVEKIGLASILHDIGMVSVPDQILSIPGELVESDLTLIYRHAEIGERVLREASRPLRGVSFLSLAADIARSHHERYDGSGYPDGLKGDAIPVAARITAVADVFDALISSRHYRTGYTLAEATSRISQRAGQDFDPLIIAALTAALDRLGREQPGWQAGPAASAPAPHPASPGLIRGFFGRFFGGAS